MDWKIGSLILIAIDIINFAVHEVIKGSSVDIVKI